MDPALQELCTQTVRFYAQTGVNEYGFQSWSNVAVPVLCHVQSRSQLYASSTGEHKVQTGRLWLAVICPWLTDRYLMEVPDLSMASGFRQVEILAVTVEYNEVEADHQVVHFGERGDRGREMNE